MGSGTITNNSKRFQARNFLADGYSASETAQQLGLTVTETVEYQSELAEELRRQAADQRFLLRQAIRDKVAQSLEVAVTVLQQSETPTKDEREHLKLRLDAAKLILSSAKDFLDDTLINVVTERPRKVQTPNIFDYRAEVLPDGSNVLSAIPRQIEQQQQDLTDLF